ncbi:MAG: response regulator [Spirochaetaceae bacterium]|nr:response regulator [Spirochaetaceae bacterium]
MIHADNSEFFRKLMRTFLTEHGYPVESSNSGKQVLDAVNAGKISLVVTGMTLSDMDGDELIKKVVTSRYKVPIIAVTSNDSEEQRQVLKALGVKATVSKNGSWQEELLPLLTESMK